MKCNSCGHEMPDSALFCVKCGHKLEKPKYCVKCGKLLQEGARFCVGCGTEIAPVSHPEAKAEKLPVSQPEAKAEKLPVSQPEAKAEKLPVGQPEAKAEKMPESAKAPAAINQTEDSIYMEPSMSPKSNVGWIIGIIIVLLLAVGLGVFLILNLKNGSFIKENQTQNQRIYDDEDSEEEQADSKKDAEKTEEADGSEVTSENEETATTEAVDLSKVDYDLSKNNQISVKGMVKNAAAGGYVLILDQPVSIYTQNENGELVLVEDVDSIQLDCESLSDAVYGLLRKGLDVEASGAVTVNGGRVVMAAEVMKDKNGKDLEQQAALSEEYVLPNSSDEYLSEADIAMLTLQEVNYAKNEIYARHGYIFKSTELKTYFEGKKWYKPVAGEGKFSESIFSKIEKANIALLREREFSMSPDGYQLDQ